MEQGEQPVWTEKKITKVAGIPKLLLSKIDCGDVAARYLSRGRWTAKKGIWLVGRVAPELLKGDGVHMVCRDGIYEIVPESLGMCSGVDDNDGVAIFEGDVVKSLWHGDWYGKIVWDEMEARFAVDVPSIRNVLSLTIHKQLEVVGNLFDMPELKEKIGVWQG